MARRFRKENTCLLRGAARAAKEAFVRHRIASHRMVRARLPHVPDDARSPYNPKQKYPPKKFQARTQQHQATAGAAAEEEAYAMAAVTTAAASSLCPGLNKARGQAKPQRTTAVCRCRSPGRRRTEEEGQRLKRRDAVLGVLLSTAAAPLLAPAEALAEATTEVQEGFTAYEDEANKFTIAVPQGWQVGAGEGSGFKSVTAFYPEQFPDSSVSVVITGIGPDFTSLKSFGTVDEFAENLVNGLDRSWQRPPGLAAKLVDSRASNGLYYIEYTLQNPGQKRRHIVSAVGMAFNGWYNRLYTVTGQYLDDDDESAKYKPQIEKSVKSFKFT